MLPAVIKVLGACKKLHGAVNLPLLVLRAYHAILRAARRGLLDIAVVYADIQRAHCALVEALRVLIDAFRGNGERRRRVRRSSFDLEDVPFERRRMRQRESDRLCSLP